MPSRASSSLLAALIVLAAGACRAGPRGCEDASNERCLWNQGVREPIITDKDPGHEDRDAGDSTTPLGADARLNDALTQMVDMMRAGLEWSLVDARARTLCASDGEVEGEGEGESRPQPASDDDRRSSTWHCDTALLIDTQSLQLEATAAVLSLSAQTLDEARSAELHELARARFEGWCAGAFEELEGTNHLRFYRCALPEGPYLVVARFPRDLDADEWAVSIAVLDAG